MAGVPNKSIVDNVGKVSYKQAIFKLSSRVCQIFREFCLNNHFVEVHTPKLIRGTSEGESYLASVISTGKHVSLNLLSCISELMLWEISNV